MKEEKTLNNEQITDDFKEKIEKFEKLRKIAKEEYDKTLNEFNNQFFEIEISIEKFKKLMSVFKNEIRWTFQESVFLVTLIGEMEKAIKEAEEKNTNPSLKVRELETLRLFLSKIEGNGLNKMNVKFNIYDFVEIIQKLQKTFDEVVEESKKLKHAQDILNDFEFKFESYKSGIKPAETEFDKYEEDFLKKITKTEENGN